MSTHKVVDWMDIDAPRADVFALLLNLERRLQLSPLWGIAKVADLSQDYPEPGSCYHVQLVQGDQSEYDTIITDFVPGQKLAYRSTAGSGSQITWTLQDVARGTRVIYEEQFEVSQDDEAEFIQSVRDVIHKWLKNIKNYSELHQTRIKRLVKWLLDRYYLRMRQDQRRVVQMILVMQAIAFISFVMAALAMGLVSLV